MGRYEVVCETGVCYVNADRLFTDEGVLVFNNENDACVAAFKSWIHVVVMDEAEDEEDEPVEEESMDEFVNKQVDKFLKGFNKKRRCCGEKS